MTNHVNKSQKIKKFKRAAPRVTLLTFYFAFLFGSGWSVILMMCPGKRVAKKPIFFYWKNGFALWSMILSTNISFELNKYFTWSFFYPISAAFRKYFTRVYVLTTIEIKLHAQVFSLRPNGFFFVFILFQSFDMHISVFSQLRVRGNA